MEFLYDECAVESGGRVCESSECVGHLLKGLNGEFKGREEW